MSARASKVLLASMDKCPVDVGLDPRPSRSRNLFLRGTVQYCTVLTYCYCASVLYCSRVALRYCTSSLVRLLSFKPHFRHCTRTSTALTLPKGGTSVQYQYLRSGFCLILLLPATSTPPLTSHSHTHFPRSRSPPATCRLIKIIEGFAISNSEI